MNKGMIAALVAILIGAVAFMLTGENPKKKQKRLRLRLQLQRNKL